MAESFFITDDKQESTHLGTQRLWVKRNRIKFTSRHILMKQIKGCEFSSTSLYFRNDRDEESKFTHRK
jgi:hypothetical protein